jgi:RNA polymerase sigma-54 factor
MKLRQGTASKQKLSQTLRSWLPVLQADLSSLKETLDEMSKENPFVEVVSGNEVSSRTKVKKERFESRKNAVTDEIEAMHSAGKSLYDVLYEQIVPPLFLSAKSQKIAYAIIDHLNPNGYFDVDVETFAEEIGERVEDVEQVRRKFRYLEPRGVGAVDLHESFLFQLEAYDLEDDLFYCTKTIIEDFENIEKYQKEPHFKEAVRIIKKFQNPPAIEYQQEQVQIIPDIFIENSNGMLQVRLNESYYPGIDIELGGLDTEYDFVKEKIKDAKSMIDALELRKATLTKIALMLVEYQYDFFMGGAIKPMKLDDLAMDLGRHHSTISRAIANKYLSCERGLFPIKSFFSTAVGEDGETSNAEIKAFIKEVIKSEDRKKPLSDNKILQKVEEKFGIKLGRRTVTKYRLQANIASSSERKKLYLLET